MLKLPINVPAVVEKVEKKDKKVVKYGGDLNEVLAGIRKSKGDKVVVYGNKIPFIRRLPTGIFEFDFATGGGFPRGRYSIVYGPESSNKTNVVLRAAASAQKLPPPCNKAVWVNVEQTFDPIWAEKMGVDTSELIVVNAGYGEEAVDLIDALVRADDVAFLAVDSLAALVPSAEIAQSSEKYDIGTAALLIKRTVNKLMYAFGEEIKRGHDPCVVLINQTRFKPGVMFGDPECLHGDTLVNFVNGRSLPIRYVVENKIMGDVWAFDEVIKKFVPAKIVSHHFNGVAKDGEFITVTSEAVDTRNGVLSSTTSCTHKFLTKYGWKKAIELVPGDLLLSKYRSTINGSLRQFLLGTGCGDMTLLVTNPNCKSHKASMKIEDSENPEYARWKVDMLSPFFSFTESPNDSGFSCFRSEPRSDLFVLRQEFEECRHPKTFFKEFSWLGFALWMMDDGNLNHDRYKLAIGRFRTRPKDRQYISEEFTKLGLEHEWTQDKAVHFSTNASTLIALKIAEFVPPCMQYKLPPAVWKQPSFVLSCKVEIVPRFVKVVSVDPASPRKYRDRRYFDIHVDGPNNYLVGNLHNGYVVHNTMPGGEAQKFLCSLRVRLYAKNVVDKPTNQVTFKDTHAVIKKAKVPVRAVSFDFKLCVAEQNGLQIGDTDSFNTVKGYLQGLGLLDKNNKGYFLKGVDGIWKTLTEMQDKYQAGGKFQSLMQAMVIDSYKEMVLVDEPDEPFVKNAMPGEAVPVELQSIAGEGNE